MAGSFRNAERRQAASPTIAPLLTMSDGQYQKETVMKELAELQRQAESLVNRTSLTGGISLLFVDGQPRPDLPLSYREPLCPDGRVAVRDVIVAQYHPDLGKPDRVIMIGNCYQVNPTEEESLSRAKVLFARLIERIENQY